MLTHAQLVELDAQDPEFTPVALAAEHLLLDEGGHRPPGPRPGQAVAEPRGVVVRRQRRPSNALAEPEQPTHPGHELPQLERLGQCIDPVAALEHVEP